MKTPVSAGIGKRIGQAIERRGASQSAVAKHFGISQSAVNQWVMQDKAPRIERIEALARLLEIDAMWLLTGAGTMAADTAMGGRLSPDLSKTSPGYKSDAVFAPPSRGSSLRDLPVYGAAEGGDGVMVLDNDPIEYMERPVELREVKGAYAVYVVNDSMFPAYEPGDKVHVHPGRPVVPGKDVLFVREEKDGTRHALIKRLVRVSDKAWKVRQFNPDHTFDLPRKIWQRAYRIMGSTRAD